MSIQNTNYPKTDAAHQSEPGYGPPPGKPKKHRKKRRTDFR